MTSHFSLTIKRRLSQSFHFLVQFWACHKKTLNQKLVLYSLITFTSRNRFQEIVFPLRWVASKIVTLNTSNSVIMIQVVLRKTVQQLFFKVTKEFFGPFFFRQLTSLLIYFLKLAPSCTRLMHIKFPIDCSLFLIPVLPI